MTGYPDTTWLKLREEYESGNYSSLADLIENTSLHQDGTLVPSLRALKSRCSLEHWEKGKVAADAAALTRDALVRALAKRGISADRLAAKIDAQLDAQKTVIIPSGAEGQSGFADTIDDNTAIDKAITQVAKVAGLYAPVKVETVSTDKLLAFMAALGEVVYEYVPEGRQEEALEAIRMVAVRVDQDGRG